jgi:hypothetical protein
MGWCPGCEMKNGQLECTDELHLTAPPSAPPITIEDWEQQCDNAHAEMINMAKMLEVEVEKLEEAAAAVVANEAELKATLQKAHSAYTPKMFKNYWNTMKAHDKLVKTMFNAQKDLKVASAEVKNFEKEVNKMVCQKPDHLDDGKKYKPW